jgi:hypothetical protein
MDWRRLTLLALLVIILIVLGVMFSGYGDCCDLGR